MRVNNGFAPIREEEPTLASMLKKRGYATGGFGKWGIGGRGTSGVPEKHGFDEFFGYYDQVHAHTFYPHYLIRNSEEVPLAGNEGISFYEGETHAQDEIFRESIRFIRENQDDLLPHHGGTLGVGRPVRERRRMPGSMPLLCTWSIASLAKSWRSYRN